jgi:hypothetical protein
VTAQQIADVMTAIKTGHGHAVISELPDADQTEIADVITDYYAGKL